MPAAIMGPIVWDELGPIPILNISKTDKNMMRSILVKFSVDHDFKLN
jgi:hypothetical protein